MCLCMSSMLFHCASAYVPAIGENSFMSLVRFIFLNRRERKKFKKAAYLLRNLMLYSVAMFYCMVSCIVAFVYTFCFPDVPLFLYLFCSFLLTLCSLVWVTSNWLKMSGQTEHFFGFITLIDKWTADKNKPTNTLRWS